MHRNTLTAIICLLGSRIHCYHMIRLVGDWTIISLGYYLPKRKPLSAYISDVCAYISDFANGPENQWSSDWNVACLSGNVAYIHGKGFALG